MSIPTTTARGINSAEDYVSYFLTVEQIPHVWDELEPFVHEALAAGDGEMTPEDVFRFLCIGGFHAFITMRDKQIELMLIAEIRQLPQYRIANIVLMAGKNVKEATHFFPAFEAWAASHGALLIEARCRETQARLFRGLGFQTEFQVIRRVIKRSLNS